MELKLVELGDHLALLSTDNEEVEITSNIDIKVEIFLNDTVEIVSLKTLEKFHNFIKNVLDFSIGLNEWCDFAGYHYTNS